MGTHKVLTAYELPAFEDILSDAFRQQFGLNQAGQYGIACLDVKTECNKAEIMGAGPFITANIPAPNWIENGARRHSKLEFALGYADEHQIEFLGPGKGTSFYSDALKGEEHVLHHVGVFQNDSNGMEKKLNAAGFTTVIDGGVHLGNSFGFKFKYFDTRDEIGCYLELLDFYLLGMPISTEAAVKFLGRINWRLKNLL